MKRLTAWMDGKCHPGTSSNCDDCNPFLDEAVIGSGIEITFPDSTFDMVISDNVLEHLENLGSVMKEVNWVLKPGCRFVAKTPNKHHYMPLIARVAPPSFHRFANRLRGRAVADTYPVL